MFNLYISAFLRKAHAHTFARTYKCCWHTHKSTCMYLYCQTTVCLPTFFFIISYHFISHSLWLIYMVVMNVYTVYIPYLYSECRARVLYVLYSLTVHCTYEKKKIAETERIFSFASLFTRASALSVIGTSSKRQERNHCISLFLFYFRRWTYVSPSLHIIYRVIHS